MNQSRNDRRTDIKKHKIEIENIHFFKVGYKRHPFEDAAPVASIISSKSTESEKESKPINVTCRKPWASSGRSGPASAINKYRK